MDVVALQDFPVIQEGDDLASLIWQGLSTTRICLEHGDILVVAQKVVSKAEGMTVSLAGVQPSAEALRLAGTTGKEARLIEVILRESREVLRTAPDRLIVEN